MKPRILHRAISIPLSCLLMTFLSIISPASGVDSPGTKTKVRAEVNAYLPVVYPIMSYDSTTMYFSRKYHPLNVGMTRDPDDVWRCTRDSNGEWSEARNVHELNTASSDVLCSISADGTTALVARTELREAHPFVRLFVYARKDDRWDDMREVRIRDFSGRSSHVYAHLTYDNSALLLAYDGDAESMDLYVCLREGSSWTFTSPRSLGTTINTRGTEGSPFLAYDGSTLYFSSDGHGGMGSQDMYMSRRMDDSWTSWSTPLNLGPNINTPALDHCFSLFASGAAALMVSADSTMSGGVFRVSLPDNVRMGRSVLTTPSISSAEPIGSSSAPSEHLFTSFFAHDSYSINDKDIDSFVDSLTSIIAQRPPSSSLRMYITGHADSTGSRRYNVLLSKRRADAVFRAIAARLRSRASATRASLHDVTFVVKGRGSTEPRSDNGSEEGKRMNRRVEVRIDVRAGVKTAVKSVR